METFDEHKLYDELREEWKRIRELEEENKRLKSENLHLKNQLKNAYYGSLVIGDRHETGG